MEKSAQPVAKHLVLVGAGNAHLIFVKRWGMARIAGVQVTLVNESARVPYSAMVPARVAGEYDDDRMTMDLVRLCAWARVRLLVGRVTAVSPGGSTIAIEGRPPLAFDALSL